jgi:PAS domain S-box-containing protein
MNEPGKNKRLAEAFSSLRRVSREINTTLDLQRILDVVLQASMRLSGASRGAILVRESEASPFDLRVAAGYTEDQQADLSHALQQPGGYHPLLEEVLRTQQSLTFPHPASGAQGRVPAGSRLAQHDHHRIPDDRAVMAVPVFYAQALTGLIVLESQGPEPFDPESTPFVEGLADQAAIAIGNARRYQEQLERGELLRTRAEQLASVLDVAKALRSDRPLEDILEEVAYGIQETVGFDLVLVSVVKGHPPLQHRVAAAGIPIPEFERIRDVHQPWSLVERVMEDRFRISQSFYIPAERRPAWFDEELDTHAIQDGTSPRPFRPRPHRPRPLRPPLLPGHEQEIDREPGHWHPRDILIVPLFGPGGDAKGVVSLDQPRDGLVPDRSTVEAAEVFAAQAAVAIDNAQMVEMLQRRADVLSLFNEISQSATAKLALDEVLDDVVETAPRLLPCDHSSIFLLDAEEGRYTLQAVHGSPFEEGTSLSFLPGEGLVGQVAETGVPLTIDHLDQARDLLLAPRIDMRTAALTPLTVGQQVVGVLCVGRHDPSDFSAAEVAMLSALADQVSVAVDNARLFEEVRGFSQELERRVEQRTEELAAAMEELAEERDRVEALYRITSQLSASLDLDHVLNKATASILDAVGADQAATLLLDSELRPGRTPPLILRAIVGDLGGQPLPPGGRATRFSVGEGLAGSVIEERAAAIVPDLQQDDRWVQRRNESPHTPSAPPRSALAVPLLVSGQVLGAVLLLDGSVGYFQEEHLRLVKAAAVQIAQAINNAELYNVIREQAERLGNMLKAQQVESTKSQAILEGVADGVMVTDADGQVTLFNAAAERILDLPREEAMGRTTREMLGLYGSQAQDWMDTVAQWREHPESYARDDFLAAQLDIEARIVSVHLAPVLMGAHSSLPQFLGTVSVFRDVTAEVEADRAKTEFVSMVSHELRTPMTSIKGYTDLMLMESVGSLSDGQEKFLSIVRNNVDRLTMLVDDLLDISRIESGRLELAPQPISLQAAVDRVVASIEARAKEKGVLLRSQLPSDLPMVHADPDRVAQVLTNLVGNAYQYTPSGGEIVVSAQARDGEVHVAVQDTGIGISPEDREKIFDRFFRADSPEVQQTSGTGLGLPIVKSLVEMQGGRIWVESELGEGSCFTFTLPTAVSAATPAEPVAPKKGSPTFLVVEDDLDIAELIQFHLSEDGREVLIAQRGDEALALARQKQPDLVTLDVMLPDMSGFELLEALKADPRTQDIPVIIVSVVPDRRQGLRLGAVDYITKPIDEKKLLAAVRQACKAALGDCVDPKATNGTILVVDDDRDTLSLLDHVLRANDFAVETVTRGDEVLALAREVRPSLVLLDAKLPGLDGYTVLEQLKADSELRDVPVILMTSSEIVGHAKRQKVLALGAERFIEKPFSVEELVGQIERAMSLHER